VIPITTQTGLLLLWISAIFHHLYGWDYFRAGIHHLIKEMRVKVKYFAWVRERIGKSEETVERRQVFARGRSDSVAGGARRDIRPRLRDAAVIRADDRPRPRQIGYHDCRRREIAFFPPMTGG